MTNDLLVHNNVESSMMDIGKNCFKCNQLDFLPFVCEYCKLVYCEAHRKPHQHQCKHYTNPSVTKSPSPDGPTSASLFPDRYRDRQRIDSLLVAPKPVSIESKMRLGVIRLGAISKLNKFLQIQSQKPKKLFDNKKVNPVVAINNLRKIAKGDVKIKLQDRIYIWCLYINVSEEQLHTVDMQKQRAAIFINKNWSIGKILDYLSDELKIKNNNNKTNDTNERLNIFKLNDNKPSLLQTNSKGKDLADGEVLYLIRGTLT